METKIQSDTDYTVKMKEGFNFFGPAVFLYACFYTFCMYRNGSGITFPFFMVGSLLFLRLCLSKLGISLKKESIFYMTSMILLSISTFITDDARIISMNKLAIFLLMLSLLLNQFYDTSKWQFGKYLKCILTVIFSSLGEIYRPFVDASNYRKTLGKSRGSKLFYMVIGLAVAFPVLLVVLSLLASADVVFREISNKMIDMIRLADIILIVFSVAWMFLAVYCFLSYFCKKSISEEIPDARRGEPLMAITATGALTLVYLVFSVIQIVYLFLGKMELPGGYTYAEYAREGYFQLLAVSIFNLIIVLVSLHYFKESKVLKAILTLMSFCTFIMIASSAMRMIIYIQYYYLTFLRILVLWSLVVLAILFIGIVIRIFREEFFLFRYSVIVVTVCFLILSYSRPDYLIAKVNITNTSEQETHAFFEGAPYRDYRFLSYLSADAAPVIIPYMLEKGYNLDENDGNDLDYSARLDERGFGYHYIRDLQKDMKDASWRNFNISRYIAMELIKR